MHVENDLADKIDRLYNRGHRIKGLDERYAKAIAHLAFKNNPGLEKVYFNFLESKHYYLDAANKAEKVRLGRIKASSERPHRLGA